jgi:hypothetical protein
MYFAIVALFFCFCSSDFPINAMILRNLAKKKMTHGLHSGDMPVNLRRAFKISGNAQNCDHNNVYKSFTDLNSNSDDRVIRERLCTIIGTPYTTHELGENGNQNKRRIDELYLPIYNYFKSLLNNHREVNSLTASGKRPLLIGISASQVDCDKFIHFYICSSSNNFKRCCNE